MTSKVGRDNAVRLGEWFELPTKVILTHTHAMQQHDGLSLFGAIVNVGERHSRGECDLGHYLPPDTLASKSIQAAAIRVSLLDQGPLGPWFRYGGGSRKVLPN